MWKLNLNKSSTHEDDLTAAAKLSPGEMFRYFYFSILGASLAADVNFVSDSDASIPLLLDFSFVRQLCFITPIKGID